MMFNNLQDFNFRSRRSPVLGKSGMVAASQPLAAAAGIEILSRGGSAADAAVAVAAALNVTEPTSTGIGGDCFALYYHAETGQVSALNGSGRAPGALTLERLHREGFHDEIPPFHPYTITVPGACAGWIDLLERFGKLRLETILSPAIHLAENGFPVAPLTSYFWQRGADRQLKQAPGGEALTISGRGPHAGEIFRNPGLARTFKLVAEGGKHAFYEGKIAEAIVSVIQEAGGCLDLHDLARHSSTWDTPISVTYRGLRIWECPPNGQGLAALLALNILEGYDLTESPPLSARRLHLQVEAMRLAFADARWYIADPEFDPTPLDTLLSKTYARERRQLIDPERANPGQVHGGPFAGSDTVYFSVVDAEGSACSFINSNYMGFGTGIVPGGYGFSLQNRGHNFSLEEDHPNVLAPGKRPYHTIIPALATYDNPQTGNHHLYACFGVMGGFMQPQGHLQVVSSLVDDRLDPQAALDRPRFCLQEGTAGSPLALEEGLPETEIEKLAGMGHTTRLIKGQDRAIFGRGQIIILDHEQGVLWGGSDGRADGCAMALY
jgi:gamma-glutamyltranspeptidase / glutathione hydrolase